MAEFSCVHSWYTGIQFRFLEDPIVLIRALWPGDVIAYYAPSYASVFGVCLPA